MMPKYKLIDLFSGCGGTTLGFVQTGNFSPIFANDFNLAALESYRANFDPLEDHSIAGDIIELLEEAPETIPKADIVIGGPPCQGFSLLNRHRESDPRRELWFQFMMAVELSDAQIVVMENVPQLINSLEYHQIEKELKRQNFRYIQSAVLTAADYGVPEIRKRAIIMASKYSPISLPRPTHIDPEKFDKARKEISFLGHNSLGRWTTVKSAIGDLPKPVGTDIRNEPPPLDLHFGRTPTPVSLERYKAVPSGGNRFDLQKNRPDITPNCWIRKTSGGTDLFGRLWWDRPSVTIRTEFFKPEKGRYLHPDQDRPITHREAARIQSFPDSFIFKGSKIEIAKQIGNAVPPRLAKAIAEEVIRTMQGEISENYVKESQSIYEVLKKTRGNGK